MPKITLSLSLKCIQSPTLFPQQASSGEGVINRCDSTTNDTQNNTYTQQTHIKTVQLPNDTLPAALHEEQTVAVSLCIMSQKSDDVR